tara:strand:- start:94 stop:306 length:213 start_codon:yes stop_codon:yes gene_type:complete
MIKIVSREIKLSISLIQKFAKIIKVTFAHPVRKVRYESYKASVYRCPPFLKKDDPSGDGENFWADFGRIL